MSILSCSSANPEKSLVNPPIPATMLLSYIHCGSTLRPWASLSARVSNTVLCTSYGIPHEHECLLVKPVHLQFGRVHFLVTALWSWHECLHPMHLKSYEPTLTTLTRSSGFISTYRLEYNQTICICISHQLLCRIPSLIQHCRRSVLWIDVSRSIDSLVQWLYNLLLFPYSSSSRTVYSSSFLVPRPCMLRTLAHSSFCLHLHYLQFTRILCMLECVLRFLNSYEFAPFWKN